MILANSQVLKRSRSRNRLTRCQTSTSKDIACYFGTPHPYSARRLLVGQFSQHPIPGAFVDLSRSVT